MRLIYTIIYYLIMPFILCRLLWRSRHTVDYRKRWNERFGYIARTKNQKQIWVHAVSVGETLAAIPFIKELLKQYSPDFQIIVTTTTPTGSALVVKNLKDQVMHVYAPFDTPTAVARFLNRNNIKLCVIFETELWPNLLRICKKQRIPVMLANGRLSERSCKRYLWIKSLTKKMLGAYRVVATQGVLDGERYLQLGLDPKKLIVTGNIKFDLDISDELIQQGKKIRTQIGLDRRVFIAASTHESEEKIILSAFEKSKKEIPNLFLILAPRHPDRFQKVKELCLQNHYSVATRSEKDTVTQNTDILLLDTIGELQMIYAAADIAFVGGSLVPVGGHNVIEPAALGLPVLTGAYLHNFTEITRLLQNAGALQIVNNTDEIADAVIALCSAKELREKIGQCAKEVIEANRGALMKHLECVSQILSPAQ